MLARLTSRVAALRAGTPRVARSSTPSALADGAQVAAEPRERAPAHLLVDALALVEQLVRELRRLVQRRDHDRRVEVVGERGARVGHELLGLGQHRALATVAALGDERVDPLRASS